MLQKQIYEEAVSRIRTRCQNARMQQEQRSIAIRQEIPETVELDRQLRNTCLAIFKATAGTKDRAERMRSVERQSKEAQALLRALLTAHGYPADYLDLHYTCSLCNDSGFRDGIPCECLKREIGIVGAEQLNRNSQLSLCSFSTFSLHYYRDLPQEQFAAMQNIFQQCRNYAAAFDPKTSGTLLMTGGTGLGKTHLSLAIANELLMQGCSVVYDAVGNLLHKLNKEYFSRGGSSEEDDTISLLTNCDLLILDDFGTEFDTQFNRSYIYTLINGRINAHKPMIVNTNLTLPELQAQYGDRILSRLTTGKVLMFYGKDIRSKLREPN